MEAKIEPCIDCPDKNIDDYGYFCDIACGKRTAWLSFEKGKQEGIREVVEWITGLNLKVTTIKEFLNSPLWKAQLKEWGIDASI